MTDSKRMPITTRPRLLSRIGSNPTKSKKPIFALRTAVNDVRLTTTDEIVKRGVSAVLADLGKQIAENDVRSHRYLHARIASIYQVAQEARTSPNVWSELCRSPLLENAPRKPNPKRPDQALRFALMASRGTDENGRKFASKWSRQLKEHFEAQQPAAAVLNALARASTAKTGSRPRTLKRLTYRLEVGEADCASHCIIAAGTKASIVIQAPETKAIHALVVLLAKSSDLSARTITPVSLEALSKHLIKYLAARSSKNRRLPLSSKHT
jgi:hypothetical protein